MRGLAAGRKSRAAARIWESAMSDEWKQGEMAGAETDGSLELDRLPAAPGVYLMRNARDEVIYVGKAANLRSRVRSYFNRSGDSRFNVKYLVGAVKRVETIVTTNEKEAFLLENTLIKKHQPRYNIRLRDDKTYVSVAIDMASPWPRAVVARPRGARRRGDKTLYFGPYASAKSVRQTLKFLQKIFPIRSCSDTVFRNRTRPCLLHQIGRCVAPCVLPVLREEYGEMVRGTILFLRGRNDEAIRILERRMKERAERMEYEKAAAERDRIQAIAETTEPQRVAERAEYDRDVIGYAEDRGLAAVVVLQYRHGALSDSRHYLLRAYDKPASDILYGFLAQFYDEANFIPPEIYLSLEPTDAELLEEWLADQRGRAVRLRRPLRGEKAGLARMAEANAREILETHLSGERQSAETLESLRAGLRLAEAPSVIECFDISNIQGVMAVGSMVVFRNGEPDKSGYRRFKIRAVKGADDFAMMREALTRRFRAALEEDKPLPSLVIVDGGKGQLNVALDVFQELGVEGVAVCALAKSRLKGPAGAEKKTRTEERLFLPNRKDPLTFRSNSPALFLLQRIRDEAHRFGLDYHRRLRRSRNLRSVLEELPGIGAKRAKQILKEWKSLQRLREASREDLAQSASLTAPLAETIWNFLHGEEDQRLAPEVEEMEFVDVNPGQSLEEAP